MSSSARILRMQQLLKMQRACGCTQRWIHATRLASNDAINNKARGSSIASGLDKWKRPASMDKPKADKQRPNTRKTGNNNNNNSNNSNNNNNNNNRTGQDKNRRSATSDQQTDRAKPQQRNWTKPVDFHAEKHEGESRKLNERHLNKFSKPPREGESVTQRKERQRKEEELAKIIREEEQAKRHLEKRQARQRAKELADKENQTKDVYIPQIINVANLAKVFGIRMEKMIGTMEELEMGSTKHDRMLSADESSLIAMQLNMNPILDERQSLDLYPRPKPEDTTNLPSRPPVVTIMGHVDHGKTTLLDTLRKTSVAAGEAGGITQHIGAFSVTLPSKKTITFLDTPGHAAFSAMRARGAQVTDIVVLVVAADDGVMPQTEEAIKHAQAAGVPLVVAVNKCDKHGVDASLVKQELSRYNVHLEEIGGEVPCVEVSGLTGLNLDQLEETIITLSEIMELKADQDPQGAEGVVLESQVEKGRGNVATVLVQRGVLKPGSVVVAGQTWCKIRSMTDHQGKPLKQAPPGTPVKVIGWKDVPVAGDEMLQAKDESTAKTVVTNREARRGRDQQLRDLDVINEKRRQQREILEHERLVEKQYQKEMMMYNRGLSDQVPESLGKRMSALQQTLQEDGLIDTGNDVLELRAIVKGDVSGTVEAVVDSLSGLQNKQIRVKVVHSGVGQISDGDVQLAAACDGQVIGFNVKADKKVLSEAAKQAVAVKSYSVIYKLLDDVKEKLSDMLPPVVTTQVLGEASILQLFDITIKGKQTKPVAGCRVTNGIINRNGKVRVIRNKESIWEGQLDTLRQVKKDINEAKKGLECGMAFEGFTDFQPGDIIQQIQTIETRQKL
ncbi:translation initiation factor IF-2 [Hesseltinella vesiculosa]|uniref:Translation initiation factor IF-2, mitochondrial n=1 Tax=Hesseltinella vesiculosa TaxID=101127 RepID=A0A1X2GXZ0_9FUNG|nr:translation initiation factor IF-2 [Hesseltinella vesiculosa]